MSLNGCTCLLAPLDRASASLSSTQSHHPTRSLAARQRAALNGVYFCISVLKAADAKSRKHPRRRLLSSGCTAPLQPSLSGGSECTLTLVPDPPPAPPTHTHVFLLLKDCLALWIIAEWWLFRFAWTCLRALPAIDLLVFLRRVTRTWNSCWVRMNPPLSR